MAIRLIVRQSDCGAAANVGGAVHETYKTFEIEAPELEAYLLDKPDSWTTRTLIGAEQPTEPKP